LAAGQPPAWAQVRRVARGLGREVVSLGGAKAVVWEWRRFLYAGERAWRGLPSGVLLPLRLPHLFSPPTHLACLPTNPMLTHPPLIPSTPSLQ
jgi:hypothetical protein